VARYPEVRDAAEEAREGGLCHRLDTETSGVLLAARSREVWSQVREAFGKRDIDKVYWAVVTGPMPEEGEIELALAQRGSRAVPSSEEAGGRPALSLFRALSRSADATLVEMKIITGVMHQVRAHLAAIGAPILGDALYGGREHAGLGRFFLHARSLGLMHPRTHKRVTVVSELPQELRKVLRELELSTPNER
jgi:23S rRNA pseudouridine1911/1915/1917 synthase